MASQIYPVKYCFAINLRFISPCEIMLRIKSPIYFTGSQGKFKKKSEIQSELLNLNICDTKSPK